MLTVFRAGPYRFKSTIEQIRFYSISINIGDGEVSNLRPRGKPFSAVASVHKARTHVGLPQPALFLSKIHVVHVGPHSNVNHCKTYVFKLAEKHHNLSSYDPLLVFETCLWICGFPSRATASPALLCFFSPISWIQGVQASLAAIACRCPGHRTRQTKTTLGDLVRYQWLASINQVNPPSAVDLPVSVCFATQSSKKPHVCSSLRKRWVTHLLPPIRLATDNCHHH